MILVTGSTGFVGRRLVAELKAQGHQVRCLVRTPARRGVLATGDVEVRYGDVLDAESLASAMEGVAGVVHLVAIIRERGERTFERVNHQGTRHVAEAARAAGVQRLVYLSGIGAADDPRLPFLRSKWQAEQEVVNGGVPCTILRASLLFGEGDEFFNVLAGVAKALPVMPVAGDGEATFQPLAVEEVARCIGLCFERTELVGQLVEVGGPEHLTYNQLVDLVLQTLGIRRAKVHLPMPVMRGLVRVLERTVPSPPATSNQLEMLGIPNTTDLDSVERRFGFRPRPVRGNIDYIRSISYRDALRTALGFLPRHIRDH